MKNAVPTVENRVRDLILITIDNLSQPRVEMAVRSITESSGRGQSSVVQNFDRRDLSGNKENGPLLTASRPVNLSID